MLDQTKQAEIKEALKICIGSENIYQFSISNNLYSEGVYKMSQLCSAEWLVTDSLIKCSQLSKVHPFIVVEFSYIQNIKDYMACVTYTDGNELVLDTHYLKRTDFPLETFKMFYENNTLYLPSER